MTDLAKTHEEWLTWQLDQAINNGHKPEIIRLLRERATPLPVHLCQKLSDYLDPDGRTVYRPGPKIKKKRSKIAEHLVATLYLDLCNDPEYAKQTLNSDNEHFEFKDETPSRYDIKNFICRLYNIGSSDFDRIMSNFRKSLPILPQ